MEKLKMKKKRDWLTGPGLVILVMMSPVVVILAVQIIVMAYMLLT